MYSFAFRIRWKFAENALRKFKPPYLRNPFSESAQILTGDPNWRSLHTFKISFESPKWFIPLGVYLPNCVKFSILGARAPPLCRWGEIRCGGVDLWLNPRQISPVTPINRCNVSPLRGENPQNRPLSNRDTGYAHAEGKSLKYRQMLQSLKYPTLLANMGHQNSDRIDRLLKVWLYIP